MLIVDNLRSGFQSSSRKKRLRTAFKAAIHSKHVQRFRESLNETKATLTLALVHERYETDGIHLDVTEH
jgi:primosomal protein N''